MEEHGRIPDRKNGINNKPNHPRNERSRNASRVVGPYEANCCDTDSWQEHQHQLFASTRPRHSVAARSEGALNVAHGVLAKPSRCAQIYHELFQVAVKSGNRRSPVPGIHMDDLALSGLWLFAGNHLRRFFHRDDFTHGEAERSDIRSVRPATALESS